MLSVFVTRSAQHWKEEEELMIVASNRAQRLMISKCDNVNKFDYLLTCTVTEMQDWV